MKKRSLAMLLTALTMLSACTSDTTASENELIDDLDDEIYEEIFDNTSVTGPKEDSENRAGEISGVTEAEGPAAEISEPDEEVHADLMEFLPKSKLKNRTVKFLSYYDPWNGSDTPYENAAAELFSEKYDGEIEWYSTTYDRRFSDFEIHIIGAGQALDFVAGMDYFPRSCIDGSVISYDDYVDWESPIWSSVKDLNDPYMIGGKHYMIACYAEEECVVFYNKNVIRENGFEDPWELYKNGEWTMSKFTSMLEDYVDEKNERYGLRGLFNAAPLTLVSGKIPVSLENGRLMNNLSDPDFNRALNYQYELYQKGLMTDFINENVSGTSQENYVSDGKALFCISHAEAFSSMGNSDDIGAVPIPKDDLADKYYHSADIECYSLCANTDNPKGAIRLMECLIASYNDESTRAKVNEWYKNEYGWTDEFVERRDDISRLAGKNPVADIYYGFPKDASSMVTKMVYTPLQTADFNAIKNYDGNEFDFIIEEINAQLEALSE